LRHAETVCDAKFHDKRPNTFAPIEIIILRCINQIKAGDPADHAESEHKWRKIDTSCLCNPSTNRSDGERQSEKEVRRAREPLRERIEKNHGESDRCEHERQPIDRRRREKKGC